MARNLIAFLQYEEITKEKRQLEYELENLALRKNNVNRRLKAIAKQRRLYKLESAEDFLPLENTSFFCDKIVWKWISVDETEVTFTLHRKKLGAEYVLESQSNHGHEECVFSGSLTETKAFLLDMKDSLSV
jgi:hypothetical protein